MQIILYITASTNDVLTGRGVLACFTELMRQMQNTDLSGDWLLHLGENITGIEALAKVNQQVLALILGGYQQEIKCPLVDKEIIVSVIL